MEAAILGGPVERGGAEEAFEAGAGDVGVGFVVHVALVVVEELELFFREGGGLEGDGVLVVWMEVGFEVAGFAFVDRFDEVECCVLAFLLPELLVLTWS